MSIYYRFNKSFSNAFGFQRRMYRKKNQKYQKSLKIRWLETEKRICESIKTQSSR